MSRFYCYGKQGFCDENDSVCNGCEFENGEGGEYRKEPETTGTAKMKVMLDPGGKMPTRAHRTDAGIDLYSPIRKVIRANDWEIIDTGVHVMIPEGYVGLVTSKSGLMANN